MCAYCTGVFHHFCFATIRHLFERDCRRRENEREVKKKRKQGRGGEGEGGGGRTYIGLFEDEGMSMVYAVVSFTC